jgi:hypothetical protein
VTVSRFLAVIGHNRLGSAVRAVPGSCGYHGRVTALRQLYSLKRNALGFDRVDYGVGGIELYPVQELESAQVGYSLDPNGRSLVGDGKGYWHKEWLVIGHETACGDPIFVSKDHPYPVFTAIHGQGEWDPTLVAPSVEQFWRCLHVYRDFTAPYGGFIDAETNARDPKDEEAFIREISTICEEDIEAVFSWAVWANIDLTEPTDADQAQAPDSER